MFSATVLSAASLVMSVCVLHVVNKGAGLRPSSSVMRFCRVLGQAMCRIDIPEQQSDFSLVLSDFRMTNLFNPTHVARQPGDAAAGALDGGLIGLNNTNSSLSSSHDNGTSDNKEEENMVLQTLDTLREQLNADLKVGRLLSDLFFSVYENCAMQFFFYFYL